ncbi:MAG: ribonuclease HII [Bdellovibrionales bacterium]|nr:ribonuclease HII [Bdellovibrionales bacterium]
MKRTRRLGLVDWLSYGPGPVIGVDEVGRGCLAGPVVAAAVILANKTRCRRFHDSKVLTESRREELFTTIQSEHQWAVGFASVEEIDRINIYHASLLAMRRAVNALQVKVGGHVLVDGIARIPRLRGMEQTTLVQGDSRAEPISAASIVAKVTRDRFMKELAEKFPHYGFEVHKGYATKFHRAQLAKVGPCAFHRRSFNWGTEVSTDHPLASLGAESVRVSPAAGLE